MLPEAQVIAPGPVVTLRATWVLLSLFQENPTSGFDQNLGVDGVPGGDVGGLLEEHELPGCRRDVEAVADRSRFAVNAVCGGKCVIVCRLVDATAGEGSTPLTTVTGVVQPERVPPPGLFWMVRAMALVSSVVTTLPYVSSTDTCG